MDFLQSLTDTLGGIGDFVSNASGLVSGISGFGSGGPPTGGNFAGSLAGSGLVFGPLPGTGGTFGPPNTAPASTMPVALLAVGGLALLLILKK